MGMKVKKRGRIPRYMKKAKRGFRGYPAASVAWYGPNTDLATKVVVGIIHGEDGEPEELRKWTGTRDVRKDPKINAEIDAFVDAQGATSVAMSRTIVGCPHESGADYEGDYCPAPECSFWVGRERWSGELLD